MERMNKYKILMDYGLLWIFYRFKSLKIENILNCLRKFKNIFINLQQMALTVYGMNIGHVTT